MKKIGIGMGVAVGAALAGAYYAYRQAFYYSPRAEKRFRKAEGLHTDSTLTETLSGWIRDLDAVPYEEVHLTARDGTRLFGRYYHVRDGAPLQIEFHGYKGMALRDYSGGDPFARRQGYNTLLVDQRAHGRSGGHTITFGIKEREDCLDWVHYAVERFGEDVKIFLSGMSMGAATVLMASGLPLPKNVIGIHADSPYSSPEEIIHKVCRDRKIPLPVVKPLLRLGARIYGGFTLKGSVMEAVRESKVPLLIIHGEADGFVPCEMSRRIADAAADHARYVTFPGADHCLGYVVAGREYERILLDFYDYCLSLVNEDEKEARAV